MNETNMRIVEELDNGDKVITYYSVKEIENKFYYVYNNVNHGPYQDFDTAVYSAVSDLLPDSVTDGL